MKFWLGFSIGTALGAYVVSNMTLDQRQGTARAFDRTASKVRSSQVGEAVADGAGSIRDAASKRVTSAVENSSDSVAGYVEPDGSTVTDTPPAAGSPAGSPSTRST